MEYTKGNGFVLMPELAPRGTINILESTSQLNTRENPIFYRYSSSQRFPTFEKFRLILYPQIKIGYMF
jgi:hypothetical protein